MTTTRTSCQVMQDIIDQSNAVITEYGTDFIPLEVATDAMNSINTLWSEYEQALDIELVNARYIISIALSG